MTEVVSPRGRGSRMRRAFMASQRDGWVLVSLLGPGLMLIARDDGTWPVVGGAAVVVLVAAGIITLVRSGRRATDGFWRAAPRPVAAMLLLLYALVLANVGTPWAIAAAGVIMAPGLWGVAAAVVRIVRWPDQPAGS